MLQRLPVHVQNLRRAGDVSLRVLQAATNVTALKLATIFAEIRRKRYLQTVSLRITFNDAVLGHARSDLVGEVFWRDFIAVGHDYRTVDRVVQLTHISRPVVFNQPS